MQNLTYNLRPVQTDTIYNLLPYVIRAVDPRAAIRAYMEAVASQHNYYLALLDGLPGLQDPTLCAAFTPEQFGESTSNYEQYLQLTNTSATLTQSQQAQLAALTSALPNTLAAAAKEKMLLGLLGSTVGADLHATYDPSINRQLIETAVYRNQIKGTSGSVYVLGRLLGFLDLKVQELWSRFLLKDPAYPTALKNDVDFATAPDQYPYWPCNLSNIYDGVTVLDILRTDGSYTNAGETGYTTSETYQIPVASTLYNPMVLNDGPTYTVLFATLVEDTTSVDFWNTAVNCHNPFGNFTTTVSARPIYGAYYLSGGDFINRASVTIPFTGGTSVVFQASVPGTWANGVELVIAADTGGTSSITMTGPQSLIKFKSSYFDLTLAADILVFSSLFPPVPVQPNDSASLDDLNVIATTSLSISAVSGTYLSDTAPLLTVASVGPITVGSIVNITGIPSLNGVRTVAEVDPGINGIVIIAEPDPPFTYANDWTSGAALAYGRLAGDYPVTGTVSGTQVISSSSQYMVDFASFLELIATLRDLFENIRPITRTLRNETYGFLLNDTFRYAPVLTTTSVTLSSSPSTNLYTMSVDKNGNVLWIPTGSTGAGDTIVQVDNYNQIEYQWGLSDQGASTIFAPTPASISIASPINTNIVFVTQTNFTGFVYIQNMVLVASTTEPEASVESIHGDDTTDESGALLPNIELVHEDLSLLGKYMSVDALLPDGIPSCTLIQGSTLVTCTNGSATYGMTVSMSVTGPGIPSSTTVATIPSTTTFTLSAAATTSGTNVTLDFPNNNPAPNFMFQVCPEDDLSSTLTDSEGIRTFWAANFEEGTDPDFGDPPEQVWNYTMLGAFIGTDPRLRATGGDPGIVEPLPTGDILRQDGPYYSYPIEYLDYSGHYLWRSRSTNQVYDTYYTYDAPNVNVGGTRVDTAINQDGQIEGATEFGGTAFSTRGFGPTPNNQAWTEAPLNHYFDSIVTRTAIMPSLTFTAASSNAGSAQLLVGTLGDLWCGSVITISGSSFYNGTWSLLGISDVAGVQNIELNTPFAGNDSGSIWVRMVSAVAWGPTTFSVTIQGTNTLTTDYLNYRVFVGSTEVLTGTLGGSPSVPFIVVNTTACVATAGQTIYVEVQGIGLGEWTATVANPEPGTLVSGDSITQGSLLMGGGSRDALEVTIVTDTTHFDDYCVDVPNFVTLSGIPTGRGGAWSGVSSYTVTSRSGGVPAILSHNDGF